MKAPDKIYVSEELLKEHNWNQTQCKDTEYIRKEALMEWATNLKERWKEPPVSVHSPGCVYMLEQVIDKLNEM